MSNPIELRKALVALHSRIPKDRISAIDYLTKNVYTPAFDAILSATEDNDDTVAEAAVWGLGDFGSLDATERLLHLCTSPLADYEIRWAAVHSLGMIGDLGALPTLFQLYCNDRSEEVREAAGRAVLRFGENALPTLLDILMNGMHLSDITRAASARLLGLLRSTDAVPHLLAAVDEYERNVRWDAIQALGEIGAPEAANYIITVLEEEDFELGRIATWTLEQLNTPESIEAANTWRRRNFLVKRNPFRYYGNLPPERPDELD